MTLQPPHLSLCTKFCHSKHTSSCRQAEPALAGEDLSFTQLFYQALLFLNNASVASVGGLLVSGLGSFCSALIA